MTCIRDSTNFACRNDLNEIVMHLKDDLRIFLESFTCNGMIVNPRKFQLVLIGMKNERNIRLDINGIKKQATRKFKLLGVETDNKLKFNTQVRNLFKTVSMKTSAFSKLKLYTS